jgi:hypothetical protein
MAFTKEQDTIVQESNLRRLIGFTKDAEEKEDARRRDEMLEFAMYNIAFTQQIIKGRGLPVDERVQVNAIKAQIKHMDKAGRIPNLNL